MITLSASVGLTIYYNPEDTKAILVLAIYQTLRVILTIICEDKVKWRMLWGGIQKDQWMQVNNFILNSIPENIMILDLKGEIRFISEYCKSFLNDCKIPLETTHLFKKVQNLQQLEGAPSTVRLSSI